MADSDDDDFQNPRHVFSKPQAPILSSIKKSGAKSMKPSNEARNRKRLKLPALAGKENRRVSENIGSDVGDMKGFGEEMAARAPSRKLLDPFVSRSVESSPICLSGSLISSNVCFGGGSDDGDEILGILSTSGYEGGDQFNETNESKVEKSYLLAVNKTKLEGYVDDRDSDERKKLNVVRGSCCSMSIESRLLGSISKSISIKDENGCTKEDDCEDFEPGTQLNELMNLCSKMEHAGDFDVLNAEASGLYRNCPIECPLCGVDISDLSEELRHVHANDCLAGQETACPTSVESRLLKSKTDSSCRVDDSFEQEEFRDVKLNIALSTSMSSCSKLDDEGSSVNGFDVVVSQMQISNLVECPMCGSDISNLSEGLRLVHTNDCLVRKEIHQLNPVESSFSVLKTKFSTIESGFSEGEDFDELEPGMPTSVCPGLGEACKPCPGIHLMEGLVQCPLCDTDITVLSEELRQAHTNECLDRKWNAQAMVPACEIKSTSPGQVVDVNPVLEWLQSLGLSRYEEAFSRQEIDWETLQCLTEEDLISIGISALGPRKKMANALNELRKRNNHDREISKEFSNSSACQKTSLSASSNKLITEYFQGPSEDRKSVCNHKKQRHVAETSNKTSVREVVGARNITSRRKVRDMPRWCCIPGTPFRVDAFCYLRGNCTYWFLTHFHIDHYQGLTRNFCHGKIYCSSITAKLVNMKIGVSWDRLHVLPLNQKVTIAGVNVTCFDANHCPGSIMILFEPSNGKAVLHTGDFRFSEEMASDPMLQASKVDTLILDTTYCNPQYDFPKQDAVIQFVIESIQAEAFNPKTLFLIGSYTIGKERVFLEVARLLRKKIFVGAAKLRLLMCLSLPEEDMHWLTANEMESHIHVVPMWTIASFKRMKQIANQHYGRFNLIVAFSPTGWSFGKGKKKTPGRRWQQGTIIRYEVPYSEHCSFTELKEFVGFISPNHIIPSVNNDGPGSAGAMVARLISDT